MNKVIFLPLCLILLNIVSFSQNTENSQTLSKEYSESNSYKPTEFAERKSKKEKKSKDKDQKENIGEEKNANQSVTVPVSVFDNQGRAILNLNKTDFKIFVDGIEIENFTLENEEEALNFILLLDTSPSTEFQIKDLQDYALRFIENLKPQDRVLIADFNQKLKNRTELTNDRQILTKTINNIKIGDGTSLYEAIQQTFEKNVEHLTGRSALVLITDGVDTTSSKSDYKKSLMEAEKNNIPVFVIYLDTLEENNKLNKNIAPANKALQSILQIPSPPVGISKLEYDLGKQYLNDLARFSGGRAVLFENISNSQNKLLPKFAEELRLKYYLKFIPPLSDKNGERKQITVRVNHPNLVLRAKGSYITN